MSKKRTSTESRDDQPTNKGSVSVFQQDENAKRAKRISLSDTTLQDLPIELIECILIKAVVMELKDMKLVKSERKEKADFVISRLRTVCSQWNSILTSNFFRNELHRTLDAQTTIRLEILHQSRLGFEVYNLTTLKDEIYVLYRQNYGLYGQAADFAIDVYDRNNMAVVKDVIPLPEIRPNCMESCSMSNCVYILHGRTYNYISILRVTKDDEHQFNITPLITDVWMPNLSPSLSVAADGSLIFLREHEDTPSVIGLCIYNANGSLRREMKMHSDIPEFSRIIPRPNGNLVLVSTDYRMQTTLTEIDMDVKIIRQYQTTSLGAVSVCNARMHGRMMLIDRLNRIELLDSELNFLDVTGPQLTGYNYIYNPDTSYFNKDRNELATIVLDAADYPSRYLTIVRFTEV